MGENSKLDPFAFILTGSNLYWVCSDNVAILQINLSVGARLGGGGGGGWRGVEWGGG